MAVKQPPISMREQITNPHEKKADCSWQRRRKKKKKKRSVLPYACRAAHRTCNRCGWKGSSSQLALGLRRLRSEKYLCCTPCSASCFWGRALACLVTMEDAREKQKTDGLDQACWPRGARQEPPSPPLLVITGQQQQAPDTAAGHVTGRACAAHHGYVAVDIGIVGPIAAAAGAVLQTIGLGPGGGSTSVGLNSARYRARDRQNREREREREIGTEEGAVCNSWQR
ncbi:hypothetical protein TESG_07466 [Trichophyton tonsurans CBS 112818]|uniref:Uncharacterized protein n=1 Tax=Trichophyton tonsurans (strain CBS 112818) TaxID=647933 RepID=F2S995_TRIT1|nr:hypothetical protein TESG_07466 [Trichophyton tonsurans CBS 112818]